MSTLDIGGRAVEYRRIETDAARATLVLLHEGLGCVALWRDFPERLAAASGLNVFVYSRYGYGGSAAAPPPWPLDYMQREGLTGLPAILDAAAIRDCVLLGHSDGASIALVHAGAVCDPRVQALIVMAPHVFAEPEPGLVSIAAAREAYAHGDLRSKLEKYHGANVDCAFRGWCDAWLHPDFLHWTIEDHLRGITVPVLQIQGAADQYGSAQHLHRIARQVSGPCDTHLLPDCRHAPQFDQPARTLSLIAEFLARLRIA